MNSLKIWGLTDAQNETIAKIDYQFGYEETIIDQPTAQESAHSAMRRELIQAYRKLNEQAQVVSAKQYSTWGE